MLLLQGIVKAILHALCVLLVILVASEGRVFNLSWHASQLVHIPWKQSLIDDLVLLIIWLLIGMIFIGIIEDFLCVGGVSVDQVVWHSLGDLFSHHLCVVLQLLVNVLKQEVVV
jgi:hypothetical protein